MAPDARDGADARAHPSMAAVGVVLVLASLALRAPRMMESVWYDEYCRTHDVLNSGSLGERLLHDVHNPLYNGVMYIWISVFGDSELSVRMPSLLAGYLSLLMFCLIIRRRVSQWAAWGVGAWCLLAPMHVWYSTEAKNNMFVLAVSTLAFWAVDRMVERPTTARAGGAAAALLAAFYTDLVTALVILPLLAWSVGESFRPSRRVMAIDRGGGEVSLRRASIGVVMTVIVGAAPWVVFKVLNVHDLWRAYLEPFRPREIMELLGGMFITGHAYFPLYPSRTWAAIAALLLVQPLLLLGARVLWRGGQSRVIVFLMLFGVAGMAGASALIDSMYKGREHFIYQPRNLLCLLYVFSTLLWVGVWRVRPVMARRGIAFVLLVVGGGASVVMQTVQRDRFTVDKPRSDWRAVAAAIEADAGGAAVVAVSRSPVLQLEHYSDHIDVSTTWGDEVGVEELETAETRATELYYVNDLDWWPAQSNEVDEWRREYAVREVLRIDRVVIYALDPL